MIYIVPFKNEAARIKVQRAFIRPELAQQFKFLIIISPARSSSSPPPMHENGYITFAGITSAVSIIV